MTTYKQQVASIFKMNPSVEASDIAKSLGCTLNHARILISRLILAKSKSEFKPYNPQQDLGRYAAINKWQDLEKDIQHIDVNQLYLNYQNN